MSTDRIPDLSTVESPPRRGDIEYYDLEVEEEPLGVGGQTVVYEARVPDAQPPETVAVRQLGDRAFTESIDKEEFAPFFDQAEMWASLARRERIEPRWSDSEHIVGVVAIGDTLPWTALEYMDGGSLAGRLSGTDGLPIEEAVWIAERLCRGLELAHNNGVAHLDLKPGNILFRQTGRETWNVPKIADWGLARELLDETSDSMDVLSIQYAAPEQFDREEFGSPGTATDIYQLGAVVYALLTGDPPYTGTERSVIFDIVTEDLPQPPSQRRGEISTELDAVVRTALEPRQSDRYGSVETFKRALKAVRTGEELPPVVSGRLDDQHLGTKTVNQWPMLSYSPSRTGAPTGHLSFAPPVSTRWEFETEEPIKHPPAVADGVVYTVSYDNLYAVDAATGEQRWQFQADWEIYTPTVVRDTVYIGCGSTMIDTNGNLHAINKNTGQQRWQFDTEERVRSPVVVDGIIYAGSGDCLFAVEATTGARCWKYETDGTVSLPAVTDDTVYFGSGDKNLYAVDGATGQQHWQLDTDVRVKSPVVTGGTIFFTSQFGQSLHAVDAVTGEQSWQFDMNGNTQSPAVADGTVYTGRENNLYAVEAATGEQRWQFQTDEKVRPSPAVVDGIVYAGTGPRRLRRGNAGSLYAVEAATGEQRWQLTTDGKGHSTPVVVDDTVYVGSSDGSLYALEGTN